MLKFHPIDCLTFDTKINEFDDKNLKSIFFLILFIKCNFIFFNFKKLFKKSSELRCVECTTEL